MRQFSRILVGAVVFIFTACGNTGSPEPTLLPDPTRQLLPPFLLSPGNPAEVSSSATCNEQWRLTGSLARERYLATATRLVDGTVLMAGGFSNSGLVSSAERYNPVTGTWSAAGNLNVPRYWHRAVVLQNGRILVVGGYSDSGPTATAEIYNPATNTWSLAASMSTDRFAHHLTVLSDGRVLAFGGQGGGAQALATAEVYNPVANTWSPVGSMATARFLAGAALLNDGRVLVAGGNDGFDYLSSAEIFNPSTGTWSATSSMSAPRYAVGMTVLQDGQALVAGGSSDLPGAEIYDPTAGTWSLTGDMTQAPRYFPETIRLADGRVLAVGGVDGLGTTAAAEIFDPDTKTWSPIASMGTARYLAGFAQLLDGRILIAGGQGQAGLTNTAETYKPCALPACREPWLPTADLAQGRYLATATRLLDNTVIVAGGLDGDSMGVTVAERYDPAANTWSAGGTLNVPRYGHRSVRLQNGRVLTVGGITDLGPTATTEIYDPATNAWSLAALMSTPRNFPQLTVLSDGRVLASGGQGGSGQPLATAEVYDPQLNTWSPAGSMGAARYLAGAALLNDGRVLVAGGHDGTNLLSSAVLFNPSTGTWSPAPSMAAARYAFGMAVLRDGRAVVAGGSTALPGAEIFNPVSNSWSPTATNMGEVPRYFSETIRLADGRVLVAGGTSSSGALNGVEILDHVTGEWSPAAGMNTGRHLAAFAELPDGRILIAGGSGNAGITKTAETYHPCAVPFCRTPWNPTGSMSLARYGATATRLANGTVIAAGGFGASGLVAGAERYDPTTGIWSAAGNLSVPRAGHRAVLLQNGRVLVAGGSTSSGPTATVEIYNPVTNTWSTARSMSIARRDLQLTVLSNGRVLAAGGADGGGSLFTAEVYNPAQNTWSPVGRMASARFLAGAALLNDGRVLVAGGSDDSGYLSSAELFNPSSGSWSAAPSMSVARYAAGITVLQDGRVLVAGGSNQSPGAEIFNPTSNSWSLTGNMIQANRYYLEMIPMADGRVLVAGGLDDSGKSQGQAELFSPGAALWSLATGLGLPRFGAVSAQLPGGRILIAGGIGNGFITTSSETYQPCPNQRPVANCQNRFLEVTSTSCPNTMVTVNNGSYDPDEDPGALTISQTPAVGAPLAVGSTTVTLTVSDGHLSATCQATVTREADDVPPTFNNCPAIDPQNPPANYPYTYQCTNWSATVPQIVMPSTDSCGNSSSACYHSGSMPLGISAVNCYAVDDVWNMGSCQVPVIVKDTLPPGPGTSRNMSVNANNGAYRTVTLSQCANNAMDQCFGSLRLDWHGAITGVSSDEEENVQGPNDGNTVNDIVLSSSQAVLLRAENDNRLNGRVYRVHYRVTDLAGNIGAGSCKVSIPRSNGGQSTEDPPLYCVGNCSP